MRFYLKLFQFYCQIYDQKAIKTYIFHYVAIISQILYPNLHFRILLFNKMSQQKVQSTSQYIKDPLLRESLVLGKAPKVQIYYDVEINAKIKKENKIILHRQKGLIQPQSFTAILGPSGSGKTTLLNFLSSRLVSDNLSIRGEIKINSEIITSLEPFSNQIGYVMQQDALLGTLTPRECFLFAAKLTLKLSEEQIIERVDQLIKDLGLGSCADTKIGNNFIKGISGGERKRTSIGVELVTNPGIIFLDEPTTGLDSTTALQVILLLKKLSQQGRTFISTIHQPSSELFCEFDRLILLCDGHCIFHGPSENAKDHFSTLGYQCPKLMNASQFYLDMMSVQVQSEEQSGEDYQRAKKIHDQKILNLQKKYIESEYSAINHDRSIAPLKAQSRKDVSFLFETYLIMARTLQCLIRNPMDVGFKLIQSIFTAIIVVIVYGDNIDNTQFQNVKGIVFFLVSSNSFAGIQGTLATLSGERPVFLRQRYSKTYSTLSYFLARTTTNFPFELMYPTAGIAIVYFITGLGNQTFQEFLRLTISVNCIYFCSASYGLFYSAIIPKLQTAMALVPVLIIPFMLLSGFFINLNDYVDIRIIFYPIMYMSPFKYGYQSGMQAIQNVQEKYTPSGFQTNILIMICLGLALRVIAFIAMALISNPKRPTINQISQTQTKESQN